MNTTPWLCLLLLGIPALRSPTPAAPTPASPFEPGNRGPAVFRVKIETTAGSFVIEAHRAWSPHGADRFHELVRDGYFNDSRFFRVVPGRWVQFGISGDPQTAERWRHRTIPDDPLVEHNTAGFVAFANTGPNTRSTEVYINTGDNSSRIDGENGFAPFGQVVEGMDTVEKLYGGYGEHSGGGMRAGHQDPMFAGGNAYMDQAFPKLDKLIRATVLP